MRLFGIEIRAEPTPPLPWRGSLSLLPSRTAWLTALLLCALAAGAPATAQEESIVVLVNDDPISAYDIEQRERFLAVTTHAQPSAELKKQATDMLIDERLQLQQGKKLSISPDESDVSRILGEMAQKNNMSVDALTSALGQMGVNIKTLKDRLRAQLVWQDVVRRKFRQEVVIGDAEVDKALAGNGQKDGGAQEEMTLQLQQVSYQIPSGADQKTIAERLAQAESLRARFASCANVAELAKSGGATVKALKDQTADSLSQPSRILVMNAKAGQMTPPTLSGTGIELYAVCGKHAAKGDPKQREDTEHQLLQKEMELRAERLLREMRQDAFIEYRQ